LFGGVEMKGSQWNATLKVLEKIEKGGHKKNFDDPADAFGSSEE
jgi:hypothetical protein